MSLRSLSAHSILKARGDDPVTFIQRWWRELKRNSYTKFYRIGATRNRIMNIGVRLLMGPGPNSAYDRHRLTNPGAYTDVDENHNRRMRSMRQLYRNDWGGFVAKVRLVNSRGVLREAQDPRTESMFPEPRYLPVTYSRRNRPPVMQRLMDEYRMFRAEKDSGALDSFWVKRQRQR